MSCELQGGMEVILAADKFLTQCQEHASKGREILEDLKYVAAGSCNSTVGEIMDMFLQGYEMVLSVASEVKFFEVKLDSLAPCVPMTKISDIRYYSGN